MNMTALCFIDTETTGLDPRIHQPYEVCYWREDEPEPTTTLLPASLQYADAQGLKVGGYWDRVFPQLPVYPDWEAVLVSLVGAIRGVTLVGSNPAFDAAMLTRVIGAPVWHHRVINVAEGAMWVFGWDRPKGLADVRDVLVNEGHDIPAPDHTAEGDVRTTRAVYYALRRIGGAA